MLLIVYGLSRVLYKHFLIPLFENLYSRHMNNTSLYQLHCLQRTQGLAEDEGFLLLTWQQKFMFLVVFVCLSVYL